MQEPIIEIKDLTYSYHQEQNILENISLSIHKGDLVAIIGHNGSGKSTLVKLIAGLLEQKTESITLRGKLSYIPQKVSSDNNFPAKVKEILDLECCDCKLRDEVLKNLGIDEFVEKQFKVLSGGQQQRVLIALALLSNPDILILDEPTVGVDTKTQEDFYKLLKKLHKERELTILFVTHDTGMISDYFTKIICLDNKKAHMDEAKNTDKVLHSGYGEHFHEVHHHHHKTKESN
ncbi:ATP-binding cassette domain-containing protein [Candidatus Woesearchaeota archaeon]|nr:ATP-binding cassette domain-containing protein [Nanoarchaeota archaeon]MCB9370434.1 ATP-binding cassette domain-containing protein [Candidatus Woesearchaeota archaeon]USN43512.1 MAG: ATP-binding cassette domain-containing protein [Candidatus Woesearchaeota archaeon]